MPKAPAKPKTPPPVEETPQPDVPTLPALRLPVVLHIKPGTLTGGGVFAEGLTAALRALNVPLVAHGEKVFAKSALHIEQVGNECHAPNTYDPPGPSVAICCFEGPITDPDSDTPRRWERGIHNLGQYTRRIALSHYTAQILADVGFPDVPVCHQGYDPAIFHPAPKPYEYEGFPRIFSGGAIQPRKGHDLVIDAFRRLQKQEPTAHLVCAWYSPHAGLAQGFTKYGMVNSDPIHETVRGPSFDELPAWLEAQGVPKYRYELHGALSRTELADLMRSCDEAWFPNRVEGATNQMLVEALACGLEVTADRTTGQADVFPFDPAAWTWDAVAPCWRDAIYGDAHGGRTDG